MPVTFPSYPFYFLRHGVTDHNVRRVVMGQMDVPLNDLGRRQARAAAAMIGGLGIASIASSPLVRARETAEIVAAELGLPVIMVEDLQERDWGEMTGRPYHELIREITPRFAEGAEEFSRRVISAISSLTGAEPALVVAHSGICRVLRRHLAAGDAAGQVPNALPLRFAPLPDGGWREDAVAASCAMSG